MVRPEGAPFAARRAFSTAARSCLRSGARSCQGLSGGNGCLHQSKAFFCARALGRTAVSGFSTKKALPRLRRPFAATDGLQNRRFEQASDGRHGKARSFFVCGDVAAAPEDGASDHGLALFVFRGTFRPPQEGMTRYTVQATNPKTSEFFSLNCPSGWLCVACAPTVCGVFYSCPAPFNFYRIIPTL